MLSSNLKEVASQALTDGLNDYENYCGCNLSNEAADKCWDIQLVVSKNKRVKAYGRCWYTEGKIEIYPHNFKFQRIEDFKDTVLHELAHHITWVVFGERGHCGIWKSVCKIIGADHMAKHSK